MIIDSLKPEIEKDPEPDIDSDEDFLDFSKNDQWKLKDGDHNEWDNILWA